MRRTGLALILAAAMGAQVGCASSGIPRTKTYTARTFEMGETEMTPYLEGSLEAIAAAKNYAIKELGLDPSNNYIRFRSQKDSRTLYWLHITSKDVLPDELTNFFKIKNKDTQYDEQYTKPITLTSFTDNLSDEEERYRQAGFDVHRRVIKDFNDGKGCDLRPSFIVRPVAKQFRSIFHEDWHFTFSALHKKYPQREINESIATFIGYMAPVELTERIYGLGSPEHSMAVDEYTDYISRSELVGKTYEYVALIENQPLSESVRASFKEGALRKLDSEKYVFRNAFLGTEAHDFRFNNAMVWKERPYTKHAAILLSVYEKSGSLKEMIKILKGVPITDDKAVAYLATYAGTKYAKK